jgi:uncharacterized protein YjbI with pentapeptide repeats
MLAAVAAVVIVAFVVTTWLLTIASGAKPGTDRANSRLDAVRTGLAAGAGAGAAVGLMLAFRRQHHQEIATDLTDRDATERRITELYTKAVEQLGNDKAPVRLGGLYALERLAQDNPAQRQTIVNVICAYLRMPFSPTPPASKSEPEATEDAGEPAAEAETRTDELSDTWQQERQVRLTAQRILVEHLRDDRAKDSRSTDPPSPRFWPDTSLDLDGAMLIDFNLRGATVASARFHEAVFSGLALFEGATFSGYAGFDQATFSREAGFDHVTFSGEAGFDHVTFSGQAGFVGTTFGGSARFGQATFSGEAWFVGATFSDRAKFAEATFGSAAIFDAATFNDIAVLGLATYNGDVRFARTTFGGDAAFGQATFNGDVQFARTTFGGTAVFAGVTFNGATEFSEVTFSGGEDGLSFARSRVLSPDVEHAWPTGWCLGPDGSGGYTVVLANDDGRS